MDEPIDLTASATKTVRAPFRRRSYVSRSERITLAPSRYAARLSAHEWPPIPIEFEGVRYPSRKALAQHFAATRGQPIGTWMTWLSRFDGDVARVLAECDAVEQRLLR